MTRRVCYLARADRGDQIVAARLVGEQTDGAWLAPASEQAAEAAGAMESARAAAAWVSERLGENRRLDLVCLDGEGGVCSWLTAPSAESRVVEAAFAQAGTGSLKSGSGEGGDTGLLVQALGGPEDASAGAGVAVEAGGRRLAVVAMQDASARLFLDALDDLGIGVGVVESFWHMLAEAWDRAAPEDGPRAARVVATEAPVVAVVLADPIGRLAWAWSRKGKALTGGSLRLARREEGSNGHGAVAVGSLDIGRLTADWLAWAAQLGTAPARVVCIVPGLAEAGLTAAELGQALGRAWPTATVDLVVHDDPVGATLGRLAREERPPAGEGLERLTFRPGRAHRRLHLWLALALVALGAGLGMVAVRFGRAAAALESQREQVAGETRKAIAEAAPDLADNPLPERALQAKVERLKGPGPDAMGGARPILRELECVVGLLVDYRDAEVEPLDIFLDENMVSKVDVNIPSSAVGEELLGSARAMPSTMLWTGKFGNAAGEGKQRYSLTAVWPKSAPGGN